MSTFLKSLLLLTLLTSQGVAAAEAPRCSHLFTGGEASEIWFPSTPNENLTKNEKAEIGKWIALNSDNEGYLKVRPLVSDAPESILYNWMNADIAITDVVRGIQKDSVKKIMAKQDKQHEGIYLSADPIDTFNYGNVLTEVVVYKNQYPVKTEFGIQWFDIQSSQFGRDPDGKSGYGEKFFPYSLAKTDFVVKDPRVLKELRFPPKQMIQKFWQRANFDQQGYLLLQQLRTAEQWLLTPNFSAAERNQIFESSPEHFSDYLNADGDFQIPNLKYKSMQANYIKLNGILQALTSQQENFVTPETGVVNYPLYLASIAKLSAQDVHGLEFLHGRIQPGRLVRLILDLGLSYRENDAERFHQAVSALRVRAENQNKESKKYLSFRKETLLEQLSLIESISK